MISRAEYDQVREMHVLQKRGPVAIKIFEKYKKVLLELKRNIFLFVKQNQKKTS